MPLRYRIEFQNQPGYLVLRQREDNTSHYTIEEVHECEDVVRAIYIHVQKDGMRTALPTTPAISWDMFVDACFNPVLFSQATRRRMWREYLDRLYATKSELFGLMAIYSPESGGSDTVYSHSFRSYLLLEAALVS